MSIFAIHKELRFGDFTIVFSRDRKDNNQFTDYRIITNENGFEEEMSTKLNRNEIIQLYNELGKFIGL